jgi:hypothetical protein
LDGEGFILQVHRVFTRICSGLRRWLPVAARLDLRSTLRWQCAPAADSRKEQFGMAASAWGEKP